MIAVLFPGQGAQEVGMGRALSETHAVARETFDEANEILGYDLAAICFEGPIERLTATEVCQPALVTTSVAAWRVAHEAGLRADLVMGHSLGEYSALVAAGSMGFSDAVRIVAERGAAMEEAAGTTSGTMAAVLGPADAEVEALCAEVGDCWPANYNCPGQVVVSGTTPAIERLLTLAVERGAKAARLAVGGAFHSPLMAGAAERLRPVLDAWEPVEPEPVFMSTTTARPEAADGMRDALQQQVTAPVRFGEAAAAAIAAGVDRGVELGPGRVLSGLMKRIDRRVTCTQLASPDDVAQAIGVA